MKSWNHGYGLLFSNREKKETAHFTSFTIKSFLKKVHEKLYISDKGTLYWPIHFKGYDYGNSTGFRRDCAEADNTAHWTMWSSRYTPGKVLSGIIDLTFWAH